MQIIENKYAPNKGNKFQIKLDYRGIDFKDGGFTGIYNGWITNNPNPLEDEISNIYCLLNNYTNQNNLYYPNYYLSIDGVKANTIIDSSSVTNDSYAFDIKSQKILKIKDCGDTYIAGDILMLDGVKRSDINTFTCKKPFIIELDSKGEISIGSFSSTSGFSKYIFRESTVNAMVFRGLIYTREENTELPTCVNCPNYGGANYALVLNCIEYKPTSSIKNILWRDPFK